MSTFRKGQNPASRRKRGVICRTDVRCKTGCVGVCLVTNNVRLAQGRIVQRRFYSASGGGTKRAFRIDTLGAHEAFQRAVAWRAALETRALLSKPQSQTKTPCPNSKS